MTIRLRYHLALLPLFLGLAVASVGLFYVVQRDEIAWGLAEESQGRALCLAAFLRSHATGPGDSPLDAFQQRALAEFAESAGGLNVQWFVREKAGWRARALFETPGRDAPPAPLESVLAQLQQGSPAARHIRRPAAATDESIGYAAIEDDRGAIRAVIGVAAADPITRGELQRLTRVSLQFVAIVLLSGLLVTEALVRRARADIAGLTAGAQALAAGDYTHVWRTSVIRELDDLSSTLQSIGRILQDGIRRTRRRFLRAEQIPGEEDVIAAYHRRCTAGSAAGLESGASCAVRAIGHSSGDDFWGVRQTASHWHVVAGRLRAAEEHTPLLQRIVRAHAARDFLLGLLSERAPADAWQELDAVFQADQGESVSVSLSDRLGTAATHGPDRVATPPSAVAPNVVGTLTPASMEFARTYLRQFPRRRIDALADELAALLADRDSGLIVVYQPLSPAL